MEVGDQIQRKREENLFFAILYIEGEDLYCKVNDQQFTGYRTKEEIINYSQKMIPLTSEELEEGCKICDNGDVYFFVKINKNEVFT